MNLRFKLALKLALLAIPSFVLVSWYRIDLETKVHRERRIARLVESLSYQVPPGCIKRPHRWNGRGRDAGPGPRMFAYDVNFGSRHPRAPVIPIKRLEPSESPDVLTYTSLAHPGKQGVLVPVKASADCHYVGVEVHAPRWTRRRPVGGLSSLALAFGLSTITGLLVSLPLVRRISRLTKAMQEASEDHPQVQRELDNPDEIGDMARSFNQLGDRVQKNFASLARRDEVLREHVANTSHDLAIPLTVIQHRLRRALDETPNEAQGRTDLIAALEESAYMSSLVRNLNVSTKLEARDLYFEPVKLDLQDVLRRIESRFVALAKMKDVEFNLATQDEPMWVQADPVLVEQAMSNVVQNAVQYVPEQGHVAVVALLRADRFCVQVIDDGPGIPEPVLDKMLTAGARDLNVRGRNPEGLGLGLSIARQVCELHDWKLSLSNRSPERGLKVEMTGALLGVVRES